MLLRGRSFREPRLTVWVCALVLGAASASAQSTPDDLARTHFDSGAAYLEQADYDSALREFNAAYDLSKRPEILINIATVYERLGQLEQAVGVLNRYLAQDSSGPRAETVRIRVDNLKKRIAEKATAAPAPSPESSVLSAAGSSQPAPNSASSPAPQSSASVPPAAPLAPAESHHHSRTPAYILLATGGALAAGSVITGILATSQHSHDQSTCSPTCSDSQLSEGRTLAATSTILTGAAVVAGAIGAVLFFGNGPSEPASGSWQKPHVSVGAAPGTIAASASVRF